MSDLRAMKSEEFADELETMISGDVMGLWVTNVRPELVLRLQSNAIYGDTQKARADFNQQRAETAEDRIRELEQQLERAKSDVVLAKHGERIALDTNKVFNEAKKKAEAELAALRNALTQIGSLARSAAGLQSTYHGKEMVYMRQAFLTIGTQVEAALSATPAPQPTIHELLECQNPVYLELRRIYCCKGAEFSRPTLEKAWKEIARMDWELRRVDRGVAEQSQWQPIDSAPKDGSHIQVADFDPSHGGFGGNPHQSFQCVVHWWQWADGTHQEEWGWYPSTGAGDSSALTRLTHWKPLEELRVAATAQPAHDMGAAFSDLMGEDVGCEPKVKEE